MVVKKFVYLYPEICAKVKVPEGESDAEALKTAYNRLKQALAHANGKVGVEYVELTDQGCGEAMIALDGDNGSDGSTYWVDDDSGERIPR